MKQLSRKVLERAAECQGRIWRFSRAFSFSTDVSPLEWVMASLTYLGLWVCIFSLNSLVWGQNTQIGQEGAAKLGMCLGGLAGIERWRELAGYTSSFWGWYGASEDLWAESFLAGGMRCCFPLCSGVCTLQFTCQNEFLGLTTSSFLSCLMQVCIQGLGDMIARSGCLCTTRQSL